MSIENNLQNQLNCNIQGVFLELINLQYIQSSFYIRARYLTDYIDILNLRHIFWIIQDNIKYSFTLSDLEVLEIKKIQQNIKFKLSLGVSFQKESEIYFTNSSLEYIPSLTTQVMLLDIHSKLIDLLNQTKQEITNLQGLVTNIINNKLNSLSFQPTSIEQEDFDSGTKWFRVLMEMYTRVTHREGLSGSPVTCLQMFKTISANLEFLSEATKQELFDITETKLGGISLENISHNLKDWIIKNNLEHSVKDLLSLQ